MRVGFLYDKAVSNVWYRAAGPSRAMSSLGHEVVLVEQQQADGRFDLGALLRCDVVHIYRRADPLTIAGADQLRRQGIAVVWDNDDDVRLVPQSTTLAKRLGHKGLHADFNLQRKMIRRADVVTTTSDYLAGVFRKITDRPVVQVENYLASFQYASAPTPHEGVVIGWVAGFEHMADERALRISKALGEVLEHHDEARVISIGLPLHIASDRYTHRSPVLFEHLKDHLRQFDIGIAPLGDVPMSYARSNIKVKEYAATGVPWLASARGPYTGLGPEQGGLLVEDNAWRDALRVLVSSRDYRMELGRRAASWATTQALERHALEWARVFELAIQGAAGAQPVGAG